MMRVISRVAVVDIDTPRSIGEVGKRSFYKACGLLSNDWGVKVYRAADVQRSGGQCGRPPFFDFSRGRPYTSGRGKEVILWVNEKR
jgi:hypothetical protein